MKSVEGPRTETSPRPRADSVRALRRTSRFTFSVLCSLSSAINARHRRFRRLPQQLSCSSSARRRRSQRYLRQSSPSFSSFFLSLGYFYLFSHTTVPSQILLDIARRARKRDIEQTRMSLASIVHSPRAADVFFKILDTKLLCVPFEDFYPAHFV